ncbi:MAG: diphosphate--fructose-6-phosphate 1-phosphotransferase [Caldilineaceae bacterium]|nr:diphosphate--fructose-6-phosphate 1-phosphotransferase [Caldilineaceae bacterium]
MNALIAQCGGPTAVINASLAAVVRAWQAIPKHGKLWGARLGMQGLVQRNWADLTDLPPSALAQLAEQPGAALGSARYRPTEEELAAVLEHLREAQVTALFLVGGNGTMAAAQYLGELAAARSQPLQVIGIPKTVDNDLAGTDVTPGYGSVARYIAQTTLEVALDLRAMRGFEHVVLMEVMGRHAGWIAAAAALARAHVEDLPQLILLPERPKDVEVILQQIAEVHRTAGICLLVTAEGARDQQGNYLAERLGSAGADDSGQRIFSMSAGVSAYLGGLVQNVLGLRCRQVRPNTIQRASAALASTVDRELAALAGSTAVALYTQGTTGVMVSLRRDGSEEGSWRTDHVNVGDVIGRERLLPDAYVAASGLDVTPAFLDYARTVAGPLPPAPLLF